MASLTPKEVNINGSDLSGSDGDSNRTYTLTGTISTTGLRAYINQVFLHKGAGLDFTYSSNILTFLNSVYDNQDISIHYFESLGAAPSGVYCSTDDVKRILLNPFDYSDVTPTNPTDTQVLAFIEEATDEIDNITQHSWREINVSEEYYDLPRLSNPKGDYHTNLEVHLRHREIRDFDANEGDKIEIWNGSTWIDWLDTKTEGRANDFWQDNEQGLFFLRYFYPFFKRKSLRMTYRFGASSIPNDIRQVCAKIAAIALIRSDDRSANLNETGDSTRMTHDTRVKDMTKEIEKTLQNRQEFFVVS